MNKTLATLATAALATLGSLGVATSASAAADTQTPNVATEAAAASAYSVAGGWALVEQWGMDWPYEITGGVLHEDGTGVIHLDGTDDIEVLSWMMNPFGGFMSFSYNGGFYYGELQPMGPYVYEGDFESAFGGIEFMPIQLTPIA